MSEYPLFKSVRLAGWPDAQCPEPTPSGVDVNAEPEFTTISLSTPSSVSTERRSYLLREQVWLLPGGEVASFSTSVKGSFCRKPPRPNSEELDIFAS